MDKQKELLRKLKALAEKGEGGEKENAQKMLDKLMQKYNISAEAWQDEKREKLAFSVKIDQRKLFSQVCYSVLGKDYDGPYTSSRRINFIWVVVTKAEYVEIEVKFNFYWKAYQKSLELFYEAFIRRNNIYPVGIYAEEKELTVEERARRAKIAAMAMGMDKEDFIKSLPEKI